MFFPGGRCTLEVSVTTVLAAAIVFLGQISSARAVPFAQVTVQTPKELLLGKTQNAEVTVVTVTDTPRLEITVRTAGRGISLPAQRKWTFRKVKAGLATHLKVPYQLARNFRKGAVEFEFSTLPTKAGSNRIPAQKQTATLSLSR